MTRPEFKWDNNPSIEGITITCTTPAENPWEVLIEQMQNSQTYIRHVFYLPDLIKEEEKNNNQKQNR